MTSSGILAPPCSGYGNNQEHFMEELRRIDLLVRALTVRWRGTIGRYKPEQLWGMVHVTDVEIEAYLNSRFVLLSEVPPEIEPELRRYWDEAAELSRTIATRLAATSGGVSLRLEKLPALFGLSEVEKDILLACMLPELDARYRRLFSYLQDDASRTRPNIELIMQIFTSEAGCEACRHLFDFCAPLFRHHLLAPIDNQMEEPMPLRALRVDDRITGWLLGDDQVDSALKNVASLSNRTVNWDDLVLDGEHRSRLQSLAGWWTGHRRSGTGAAVLLHGPYGSGRLTTAQAIVTQIAAPLLVVNIASAQRSSVSWERIVDLAYREARLQNAAIYWSGFELLLATDAAHRLTALLAAAEDFFGLTFFGSAKDLVPAKHFRDVPFLHISLPMPAYAIRLQLWDRSLPAELPNYSVVTESLANGFQLTAGQIADVMATAYGLASTRDPENPTLSPDDLFEGCRRQSGHNLATFARRIEPRTTLTFNDLVLPKSNRCQLDELRARIRNRNRVYDGMGFEHRFTLGKGLIAMFTGASGTGKTMAAELLAREQGVDLYKIDLSEVVSKYVGETEKNLNRVFEEAEDSNAIIFFDEADALFGKRGDVKEAKDRWANIEVNFLLQRVEEYSGVVVLASNLRQNIDEAFLRRIHIIVDFPSPDAELRARIWNKTFPAGVEHPPEPEIRALAERFRVPGGSIRNIVLDAAFRAMATAGTDRPVITLRHLVLSIAREYQKLGKPITKGEFEVEYYSWVESELL
jgi:AAA+ superfamily predicted ATPase